MEQFIAIAYFRIPKYRQKLLEIISSKSDQNVHEWRGTEWGLDEEVLDDHKNY